MYFESEVSEYVKKVVKGGFIVGEELMSRKQFVHGNHSESIQLMHIVSPIMNQVHPDMVSTVETSSGATESQHTHLPLSICLSC